MHALVISLLTILTGTLLLAKFKKENLSKFFTWVSWFFIVVGIAIFLHFAGFGIWRMTHHDSMGYHNFRHEMMMKNWNHRMPGCMPHDSMMKCCPKHMEGDSVKLQVPKK